MLTRSFLLALVFISACTSGESGDADDASSAIADALSAAKGYSFAVCLPENYYPKSGVSGDVFTAVLTVNTPGQLEIGSRIAIEFALIERGAWGVHCAAVPELSDHSGVVTHVEIVFDEVLDPKPDLVVIYYPSAFTIGKWGYMNVDAPHGRGPNPTAIRVPSADGQTFVFNLARMPANEVSVAIEPIPEDGTLLPNL